MRVTFDRGVVMHYVVLFAYRIMLNILRRKGVTKILPKRLHCHFECPLQCNKKKVRRNFVSQALIMVGLYNMAVDVKLVLGNAHLSL